MVMVYITVDNKFSALYFYADITFSSSAVDTEFFKKKLKVLIAAAHLCH